MARKENKLRPYRVDFFNIPEMKADRALVKSLVVRAVTAQQAKNMVLWDDPTASGSGMFVEGRIVIRSYRYYKTTPAAKEVFKAIEDLFTEKKAIDVMEVVEKYRALLATPPAPIPTTDPAAVESALKVQSEVQQACDHGNATNAPVDTCNHGEAPCGTPEIAGKNDYADPDILPAPTAVEVPNYTFPDHPVVPTQPAVFDGSFLATPDGRAAYVADLAKIASGRSSLPAREPDVYGDGGDAPMPLPIKLALFGGVAFVVVIIVLAILHCAH